MKSPTLIDYFSLIILIILALAIFLVRIFSPTLDNSPLVNTLFSFFEITFSLLIGFLLQRIDSNKRFYEDLRKYGLSAYRRISDISKALVRAKSEIVKQLDISNDNTGTFNTLSAIIEGIDETVKSSIIDWMDIIGSDLEKQKKIQELEADLSRQKLGASEDDEKKVKIHNLQEEINTLKSQLPYLLQEAQVTAESLEIVENYLLGVHSIIKSIALSINISNPELLHDDNLQKTIKEKTPFTFVFKYKPTSEIIDNVIAYDSKRKILGSVYNPFMSNSLYYSKICEILSENFPHRILPHEREIEVKGFNYVGVTGNNIVVHIPVPPWSLG